MRFYLLTVEESIDPILLVDGWDTSTSNASIVVPRPTDEIVIDNTTYAVTDIRHVYTPSKENDVVYHEINVYLRESK